MEEESNKPVQELIALHDKAASYPQQLLHALAQVSRDRAVELYVVGGTVRDWLLGGTPNDLDITVACDAVACCRNLIARLGGGTFVPLGCTEEDAGRVVWRGLTLDFSSFRLGVGTIEEDLCRRDYTVNAMGIPFTVLLEGGSGCRLLDPLHGLGDLKNNVLRVCPQAFEADPLRMLRGYRLRARFGFSMNEKTTAEIVRHAALLQRVAAERISHELDLIMESERAHVVLGEMAEAGLLWQILPELAAGVGMEQPGFHHLDVFYHSLAALGFMEAIVADPDRFYPQCVATIKEYVARPGTGGRLKWAALLHDLGKPPTRAVREDRDGRITFYNHDQTGRDLAWELGRRLRWSNDNRQRIADLIGMHMQPFHLCNVMRQGPLSRKACLNLSKKAGDDLVGLFLLAMADSLAGQGEKKPPSMEAELAQLLEEVLRVYEQHIKPAVTGPRLLSGHDLMTMFSLSPGPVFARILDGLELARVEGTVSDREDACRWVRRYLEGNEGRTMEDTPQS